MFLLLFYLHIYWNNFCRICKYFYFIRSRSILSSNKQLKNIHLVTSMLYGYLERVNVKAFLIAFPAKKLFSTLASRPAVGL